MITKWSLRNFKAIRSVDMELGALTIIAGTNSSGKSTIVQSMAVVAQTMAAYFEDDAMVLNGHLVTLGPFSSLKTAGASDELSIAWSMRPQDAEPLADENLGSAAIAYDSRSLVELDEISCSVHFTSLRGSAQRPTPVGGALEVVPVSAANNRIEWKRVVSDYHRARPQYEVHLDQGALAELGQRHPTGKPDGCELRHFLPSRMLLSVDLNEQTSLMRAQALCLEQRVYRPAHHPYLVQAIPDQVLDVIRPILGSQLEPAQGITFATLIEQLEGIARTDPTLADRLKNAVPAVCDALKRLGTSAPEVQRTSLPGRLPDGVAYIESYFATKFHYLGPLRDEPRGVYPYPAKLEPFDVGRRGEFTAAAYHAYADFDVDHAVSDQLESLGPFAEPRRISLKQAVDEWLRYFGIAEGIVTSEDRYGHVLSVDNWSLIHVGTGVSQILPIIVLGLLSQPDDVLVIEHPELHLHPYVQARVADFFLFLALSGRQIVLETHSEHVINRVRRRIAQDSSDTLRPLVAIHFAEFENGVTTVRPITVTQFGAIPNWPRGFFDEAADEAEQIVQAALSRHEETPE